MRTISKNLTLSNLPNDLNIIIKIVLTIVIILINYTLLFGNLEIGNLGGIDSYGVIGILSIAFILLIIFLGMYTKRISKYSYIGIFYLVLLFFVPQIFVKLPIFPFVYRIYGHINYIIHTGHTNPDILGYQTWPGVMFLGAILEIVSKIGLYVLLMLPILFYLIDVPIIYLLLKGLSKDSKKAVGGVLFWITGSYGFGWFVPGVLAGYLKIVGIYILFGFYLKKNTEYLRFGIILTILTLTLVFTHLLTSIFWLLTIVDFLILSLFVRNKRLKTLSMFLLTFFMISQYYWIFGHQFTIQIIKSRIIDFLALFLGAIRVTEKWITVAQTGLTQHAEILRIKAYFMYSIIGVALVSTLLILAEFLMKLFKIRKVDKVIPLLMLLLISYSLGIPAIAGGYSGEIFSRLFGGSRYIFVIFFTLAFKNSKFKKVAIISLFIFTYLHILCTYGNMAYDYVAFNEITGISFVSKNIPSKFYTIYGPLWDMEYVGRIWQHVLPMNPLRTRGDNITKGTIVLSSRRIVGYKFFTGKKIDLTSIQIKSSRVYISDNGYMSAPSRFEIYWMG